MNESCPHRYAARIGGRVRASGCKLVCTCSACCPCPLARCSRGLCCAHTHTHTHTHIHTLCSRRSDRWRRRRGLGAGMGGGGGLRSNVFSQKGAVIHAFARASSNSSLVNLFRFGKDNNSSRRVSLNIELELNNLNSILSRSAVTPVFPLSPAPRSRSRSPLSNPPRTRLDRVSGKVNSLRTDLGNHTPPTVLVPAAQNGQELCHTGIASGPCRHRRGGNPTRVKRIKVKCSTSK